MPQYRKDQYVICKYNGDNGDLIVGRIESVRTNGLVNLTNLLTGKVATKKSSVLTRRNLVVKKAVADTIVRIERVDGKARARSAAATVATELQSKPHAKKYAAQVTVSAAQEVGVLVKKFEALTLPQQQLFAKLLWGQVLTIFGID